jgi:uncharacterized protein YprB with RNaseH-like and TPR domain
MHDDLLRRRLEGLNREALPASAPLPSGAAASAISHAERPVAISLQRVARQPVTHTVQVVGLLRSGEVIETPVGPHLRIDMPLEKLWQGGEKLIAARQAFLRSQLVAANQAVEPTIVLEAEFTAFVTALPDRTLALDLETCGLAGSALFLVGLLRQVGGVPTVQLLLARNYAEEAAVLASLWQLMAEHDVLLTFNGKTFDWPMVVERSVRHRLQPVGWALPGKRAAFGSEVVGGAHPTKVHIDILHHARRRWKKQLPNCRLQTLEQHICRRTRTADIPGHAIPAVYADYVRTGFEREMDTVLYHNALDLVTLFDLAHRLAA